MDVNDFFGTPAENLTMPDVMIDIETMGLQPNAPLVALGAVTFDWQRCVIGEQFYARIDLQSCVDQGAVIDASTVLWWMDQSDDARREITSINRRHIVEALTDFTLWLRMHSGPETATKLWCSALDIDVVILKGHYERAGLDLPWRFWQQRCFRTIAAHYANVEKGDRSGHHKALDDAIFQVEHLFKIRRALRGGK